jgi:hypothetical protein
MTWALDDPRMNRAIQDLLEVQDGVISRRQAWEAGLASHEIRRLLRRGEWVIVHRGVYVVHAGPLTWRQRAWSAILWAWPAALWGESALRCLEPPPVVEAGGVVHIAVGRHRSGLQPPPGVTVHHVERLAACVLWNATPPRVRVEEAALDAALSADSDLDAIAILARWIQRRRTTPHRLIKALSLRKRAARRRWLGAVLTDLAAGTCSVLEHGFLVHVERPHRLPRAERQRPVRSAQGLVYRDADYGPLLVELDGRLYHDSPSARDRDLERDLDAAVGNHSSIRLGWGQVFRRPCSTAAKLAVVMRHHGLVVKPRPCGPSCPVR